MMRYRDIYWLDDKLRWWGRRALLGLAFIMVAFVLRTCADAVWPPTLEASQPTWSQDLDARWERMRAAKAAWQDTATFLRAIRLEATIKRAGVAP